MFHEWSYLSCIWLFFEPLNSCDFSWCDGQVTVICPLFCQYRELLTNHWSVQLVILSLHRLHVTHVLSCDRGVTTMASFSVVLHATASTMLSSSFPIHHKHNGEESPSKRMKALASYEDRISLQLYCYGCLGWWTAGPYWWTCKSIRMTGTLDTNFQKLRLS